MLTRGHIEVEREGRHRYRATAVGRPDGTEDFPFPSPVMELGPFYGRRHRSAWRKAWKAAGRPEIVSLDEL